VGARVNVTPPNLVQILKVEELEEQLLEDPKHSIAKGGLSRQGWL
jgi:hypothetical protein